MTNESGWTRISPRWLEQLGYTIERGTAQPTTRVGRARNVLAGAGALFLTLSMTAITHAAVIVATVAAAVGLVALPAFAGRRWLQPRRRRVPLPAPDPELTARIHTVVSGVTVQPIGQREPVSLPGPAARRGRRA